MGYGPQLEWEPRGYSGECVWLWIIRRAVACVPFGEDGSPGFKAGAGRSPSGICYFRLKNTGMMRELFTIPLVDIPKVRVPIVRPDSFKTVGENRDETTVDQGNQNVILDQQVI